MCLKWGYDERPILSHVSDLSCPLVVHFVFVLVLFYIVGFSNPISVFIILYFLLYFRRRLKAADDTKKRTRKLQIRWSRKTPKSVSSTNLLAAAADGSSVEIVRGEMQEIKEMEEERAGEGEGDDEEKDEDSVTEEQNEKTISVSPSGTSAIHWAETFVLIHTNVGF